jgi:hypothetical protein
MVSVTLIEQESLSHQSRAHRFFGDDDDMLRYATPTCWYVGGDAVGSVESAR